MAFGLDFDFPDLFGAPLNNNVALSRFHVSPRDALDTLVCIVYTHA